MIPTHLSLLAGRIGKVCHVSLLIVGLLQLVGCQGGAKSGWSPAPRSSVVEKVAYQVPASDDARIESAQIVYVRQLDSTESADNAGHPRLILLAVEYPHPDGRMDQARAEVVVSEGGARRTLQSRSERFGLALGGFFPGLQWGAGIRQAHSLDVPRTELESILAHAPAVSPIVAGPTQVRLAVTINGQSRPIATTPHDSWDRLATQVVREGKLIAYQGDSTTLEQQFGLAAARWQAVAPTAQLASLSEGLQPLPPVAKQ